MARTPVRPRSRSCGPTPRARPGGGLSGQRLGEPGLADAGLAGDEHHAAGPRGRRDQRGVEGRKLGVPSDEDRPVAVTALGRRRGDGDRRAPVEVRVLPEDPILERPQLGFGLGAELAAQHRPALLVRAQRLRLTSRPVQGEHQGGPHAGPQGVVGDDARQLRGDLTVTSGRQERLGPRLQRLQAQLLEPADLGLDEPLVGQLAERGASPHRPGRFEDRSRLVGALVGEGGAAVVEGSARIAWHRGRRHGRRGGSRVPG